jgi:hypothetical protein
MAKDVLIVGPPRSGTSLASYILYGLGYHVGHIRRRRHRLGDDHNPYGYFEADDVVDRNAELLRRAGYRFHNTWTFDPISAEHAAAIHGLAPTEADRRFVAAYRAKSPWLWKDPRLCFTLAYWWRLMDPDRSIVFLTTRRVRDAYLSFRRKGWCRAGRRERHRVVRLLRQHREAAWAAVESLAIPHVAVDYAEYTQDPQALAEKLTAALGVGVATEDLNFHPELDHSGLGGRISGLIRRQLKRLPREPVERAADLVPAPLLRLLFPERVHLRVPPDRQRDPQPHACEGPTAD